ncbi:MULTISPECIES: fluoride efflux transporter FluC [Corynebacterium]|uniref:fluoride efflux transporter FluC n=1 Tax=Corynebacterium TaxID=1716 RepID=UPI001FEE4BCB|nr:MULTISPECIES: CrcB family protein [Corynebacterium]MDK7110825.1 CrcB family protein [Corynebacterium amycolatum]MDK7145285.1 CrcB family protein [Corynebacterium amycolatum]
MNEESVAAKLPSAGRAQVLMALSVAGGAAIGAVSRFLLGAAIDAIVSSGISAVSITVVNLLGCFLFGLVSSIAFTNPRLSVFCGTGFCGGFTTFSAFVILLLAQADTSVVLIVSVGLIHLLCCPLAYWLGTKCSREVAE